MPGLPVPASTTASLPTLDIATGTSLASGNPVTPVVGVVAQSSAGTSSSSITVSGGGPAGPIIGMGAAASSSSTSMRATASTTITTGRASSSSSNTIGIKVASWLATGVSTSSALLQLTAIIPTPITTGSVSSASILLMGKITLAPTKSTSTNNIALIPKVVLPLSANAVSGDNLWLGSVLLSAAASTSSTNMPAMGIGFILAAASTSDDTAGISVTQQIAGMLSASTSTASAAIGPFMVVLASATPVSRSFIALTIGRSLLSLDPAFATSSTPLIGIGYIVTGTKNLYRLIPGLDLSQIVGATRSFGPFGETFDAYGSLLHSQQAGLNPPRIPVEAGSWLDYSLSTWTEFLQVLGGPVVGVWPSTAIMPGEVVTVSWDSVSGPTRFDWIGLFKTTASNTNYVDWFYTSSGTQTPGPTPLSNGQYSYTVPALTTDDYEFRLFPNSQNSPVLAVSNTMHVSAVLTVGETTVPRGGSLFVTWAGVASPSTLDWIAQYIPGALNTSYGPNWVYDNSNTQTPGAQALATGSLYFTVPTSFAPGIYELRLLTNNTFTKLATSSQFTVT
jgi:hypothetical protein